MRVKIVVLIALIWLLIAMPSGAVVYRINGSNQAIQGLKDQDVVEVNTTSIFNVSTASTTGINIFLDVNLTPNKAYQFQVNETYITTYRMNSTGGTNFSMNLSILKNMSFTLDEPTYNNVGFKVVTNAVNMNNFSFFNFHRFIRLTQVDYTVNQAVDDIILVNASAKVVYVSLPDPVGRGGLSFTVKKKDSSANVVALNSTPYGRKIDGAQYANISVQYNSITVISDNEEWVII